MAPWEKPSTLSAKYVLKHDWSVEEKAFKDNHSIFLEGIKCANKITLEEITKEIIKPESQAAPEDTKINQEIKYEAKKEDRQASVESGFVGDMTALTTRPTEPKESKVSDPFDDVFDSVPTQLPIPEKNQAKTEHKSSVVETSIEIKSNQSSKKADKSKPVEEAAPLLSGFSNEQFSQVQCVIDRILKNLTNLDLDIIQDQLPNYAVELTLDHYRENPRNIDEKIAEIKKNQDGIQGIRRQLYPIHDKVKIAWEYASKVGIMCSTASSAEKRVGQVMIHCEEIFLRYSRVKSLLEQCEQEYEHLQSQYEACSRLVSFYTALNPRDVPLGYSQPAYQAPAPATIPAAAPVVSKPDDDPPPFDIDDPLLVGPKDGKFVPRPPDVPGKVDMSKVTSLENFGDKQKPTQTSAPRGTRSIDF